MKVRQSIAIAALAVGLLAGGAVEAMAEDCSMSRVDLRTDKGQARFSVEIADDAQERALGLMNRPKLGASRGMLFVYDRPGQLAFWMKNTLIPLDIIFLTDTGTVLNVAANARPGDLTPLPSTGAAQYVLEINGGLAARLGIGPGTVLRHPAIDPARAAWPCD